MFKRYMIGVFVLLCLCMPCVFAEEGQESVQALVKVEDYSFSLTAGSVPYGTRLSDCVLTDNGSTVTADGETVPASTFGSFAWRDGNQVPTVGTHVFSACFVPNQSLDGVSFQDVQVQLTVVKARPQVSQLPQASAIQYGQSLNQSVLSGGVMVNPVNASLGGIRGEFAWELRDMVPSVGLQQATVIFTPVINDAELYESVYLTVPVTVEKWSAYLMALPAADRALTFGEPLSALSLSGGSAEDDQGKTVPGSFAFQEPDRVLPAGTHTAAVLFTPADSAHVQSVQGQITVQVEKARPVLSVSPMTLTYGQSVGEGTISGSAQDGRGNGIAGTWQAEDPSWTPSVSQSGESVPVCFVPDDGENYFTGVADMTVLVMPKEVVVTPGENWKYAGMADGNMNYSVSGLPEGEMLQGAPVRESGEMAGSYVLSLADMQLPAHLQENYVLIVQNGVFEIRNYDQGVPVPLLSPSEPDGNHGWYLAGLEILAPAGYEISLSSDGVYAPSVPAPESAEGALCYLRVSSGPYAGALCGSVQVPYRMDASDPRADQIRQTEHMLTLLLSDDLSGIDRVYAVHNGSTESFEEGVEQVECTYYVRESGDYTFVLYDRAGNTASLKMEFEDTDQDGLTDVYEAYAGTDPALADSDGDGVNDFEARRIRLLLGLDEIDVPSLVLLGMADGVSENAALTPDESTGLLTRLESAPVPFPEKMRGLIRLQHGAAYGMQENVLWYRGTDGSIALDVGAFTGNIALAPHTPDGILLFGDFLEGASAGDLKLLAKGKLFSVQNSAGCERFDISPDGSVIAWYKNGKVSLMDTRTGKITGEFDAEAGAIFQFDETEKLVMENACLVLNEGIWRLEEGCAVKCAYLAQPLAGEGVVCFSNGRDESYLVHAKGQAVLEGDEAVLSSQGACVRLAEDETLRQGVGRLLQMELSETCIRHIPAE